MSDEKGRASWIVRAWRAVWRRPAAWSAAAVFFMGGGVALSLWFGFTSALAYTNDMSFCIGCHEMEQNVYQEYLGTVHYKNASGVRATCPDCHVPKPFIAKMERKIQALGEVYHWMLGTVDTPEKFNDKRKELAERVWASMRATNSRECRTCHDFETMKFADQRPRAQQRHPEAIQEGQACIECHRGIAHRLPPRDD